MDATKRDSTTDDSDDAGAATVAAVCPPGADGDDKDGELDVNVTYIPDPVSPLALKTANGFTTSPVSFEGVSLTATPSGKTQSSGCVKRKTTVNVSLLGFVKLLHRVAVDVAIHDCDTSADIIEPYIAELTSDLNSVTTHKLKKLSYVADCASAYGKKMKMKKRKTDAAARTEFDYRPATASSTVSCDEARANRVFDEMDPKVKRVIYLRMMLLLFVALERINASLHFGRESLKYFLATHQHNVSVSDFVDTNRLKTTCAKLKTTSRLSNGAILVEYAKSKSMFASNLSRCDSADVDAIRFIVETGMSVSQSIYRYLLYDFTDVPYVVEKSESLRPDHVRIPIMNVKRTAMMITDSVVLMFDGRQFALPSPAVERDITATIFDASRLSSKEYVVLDVLLTSKLRLIDMISTNVQRLNAPVEYAERLKLLSETFPDIKTVSLNDSKFDGSYIQKSVYAYTEPVYYYQKPNHTLAAVGLQNNTVLLAYEDDRGDLVFKLSTVNSGQVSLALGAVKLQQPAVDATASYAPISDGVADRPTILSVAENGTWRKVNIVGLAYGADLRLFTKAVRVEWKDGNKLGSLSRNPVTNVSEYKPLASQKESGNGATLSMNSLTTFMNDPNNLDSLIKAISKSTQFDAIVKYLQNDTANMLAVDLGFT